MPVWGTAGSVTATFSPAETWSVFFFVTGLVEVAEQIPLNRVQLNLSLLRMWLYRLVFNVINVIASAVVFSLCSAYEDVWWTGPC